MLSSLRLVPKGVRALRPTRPAVPTLHLAEPPCNGLTQDGEEEAFSFSTAFGGRWYSRGGANPQSPRRTETDMADPVRRHKVVADGRADVRRRIDKRAATQHTA